MEAMAELELAISEFYKTCGEIWQEDKPFWSGLAEAEICHVEFIKSMAGRLRKNPGIFEIARPINTVAINTAINGVKNNVQKLKKGDFDKKKALFISRDTELSILESKYADMLKTTDHDFKTLVTEITVQTENHRNLLTHKIEQAKGTFS